MPAKSTGQPSLESVEWSEEHAWLPAPSDLLTQPRPQRKSSYVEADLIAQGEDYNPELPDNRVSPSADSLVFSPMQTSASNGFASLAWAVFPLEIDAYDLNPEVTLYWSDPPVTPDSTFIALANWDTDRWDLYRAGADQAIHPLSLEPYFDFGGDILITVLQTGSEESALDYLRVGTELPVASLTVTGPRYAYGSLQAQFDAGASSDPDGSIVKYEWDFDGDGQFEDDGPDSPMATHLYETAGTFPATVRVTDEAGITATASLGVSVGGNWHRTVGATGYDAINDLAVAPDGSIWACGQMQNELFNGSDLSLWHWSASGELLDQSYWRSGGFNAQTGSCLCVAPDGRVYLAGIGYTSGVSHAIFQTYSAEGELLGSVSRGDFLISFEELLLANNTLYAIGSNSDVGPSRGVVYRVSASETPYLYGMHRLPEGTSLTDGTYFFGSAVDPAEFRLVGSVRPNGTDDDLLYCVLDLTLSFKSASSWGAAGGTQLGKQIVVTGGPINFTTYLTGYRGTNPAEAIVIRPGVEKAYNIAGSTHVLAMDLWADSAGGCYAVFVESSGFETPGLTRLLHLDSSLSLLDAHNFAAQLETISYKGIPYPGGAFLLAGQAPLVGGSFETGGNFDLGPSADWTDRTLTVNFETATLDANDGEVVVREPVFDTGAGNQDALAVMHKLMP